MKNLDRPEVKKVLNSAYTNSFMCDFYGDLEKLGFNHDKSFIGDWLDSEYEEPKYYWHIKGFGKYGYLNFFFKQANIRIDNKHQFVDYVKTKFTEQEYRELCEEFGFDFDIFKREEVEKWR